MGMAMANQLELISVGVYIVYFNYLPPSPSEIYLALKIRRVYNRVIQKSQKDAYFGGLTLFMIHLFLPRES